MQIYKVYVYSTASERYFKTKKSVNAYLDEFYQEYKNTDGRHDNPPLSKREFLRSEGVQIIKIEVE